VNSNHKGGLGQMFGLIESFPDQLAASREVDGLDSLGTGNGQVRRLVLCAMGGSAISGDLVQGLLDHQPVSLEVWRNYGLPHWVGPEDLVIAASYSGNTEECLSAVAEARKRGVPVLGITSGGQLAQLMLPGEITVGLPGGLPPRAALGHSFGALLRVLDGLGMINNLQEDLSEAIGILQAKAVFETLDPAALAADVQDRIPVIYVGDTILQGVAVRWKGQLNENSKVPAQVAAFPELNHNDIVGWGLSSHWQDRFVLIIIRSGLEDERLNQRISITTELLRDEFAAIHTLTAAGHSKLARIMSLVQYGDYLSFHLADLRGEDPMPVTRIDHLKSGLSNNNPGH
jgi:glucose/mannose-6-phosphate isomerase